MELGRHPFRNLGSPGHQLIPELDHRHGCPLPALASQATGRARLGCEDAGDPYLIATLAAARSARIAPWSPPTSSSLADDKACPLAPPQHGGGAIRLKLDRS